MLKSQLFKGDMNLFYRLTAGMLHRGYPLPEILESLAEAHSDDWLHKRWLCKLASHVREGLMLSKAMQKRWIFVHPAIVAFIEVGEKYSILPQALTIACELNDSKKAHKQKITPLPKEDITINLIIASVSLIIFLGYVAPAYQDMFTALEHTIPELTLLIIDFSNWIKFNFKGLIFMILCSIIFITCYPSWLYRWKFIFRLLEMIPFAGRIFHYSLWWKVLYGAGSLLQLGVPLDETFAVMGKGLKMPALAAVAGRISARLRQGIEPGNAIMAEKIFPDGMRWAVAIAETNGDIPNALVNVGTMYRELRETLLARFISVFSVLLIMIMVVIVGVLVVSMYLPIFAMPEVL